MKTIGILGDIWTASTGFSTVLTNLANELSRWFNVIYFGRFGREKEFDEEPHVPPNQFFSGVFCQGGVWDRELVVRLLKHYDEVDMVLFEDDFFSSEGLIGACNFWDKPVYMISPIDSLPLPESAFTDVFSAVDKLFIPNSSYLIYNGRKRLESTSAQTIKRAGYHLKSVYLPHGVSEDFRPMKVNRSNKFTFLWMGRVEERKNPAAFVLAVERVCGRMDADYLMRSDWNTSPARRLLQYIYKRNLPITLDQMADCVHSELAKVYNKGDMYISTSKAGGFELGIIEAAASGLPCICTDFTFMNENVVNGKSGILVHTESFTHPPPSHPEVAKDRIWGNISIDGLADAMVYAFNNQEQMKAMGRWALMNTRQRYRWKDIATKLKDEILE